MALLIVVCLAARAQQNFVDVKPAPQQTAWQDREFGVILHFGTNTFLDREWGDGAADPKVFNPTEFNPDQWMEAIKAAGASYVVFVAKHHDGLRSGPQTRPHTAWRQARGATARAMSLVKWQRLLAARDSASAFIFAMGSP